MIRRLVHKFINLKLHYQLTTISVLTCFIIIAAIFICIGFCPWYLALAIALIVRCGLDLAAVFIKLAMVRVFTEEVKAHTPRVVIEGDTDGY